MSPGKGDPVEHRRGIKQPRRQYGNGKETLEEYDTRFLVRERHGHA